MPPVLDPEPMPIHWCPPFVAQCVSVHGCPGASALRSCVTWSRSIVERTDSDTSLARSLSLVTYTTGHGSPRIAARPMSSGGRLRPTLSVLPCPGGAESVQRGEPPASISRANASSCVDRSAAKRCGWYRSA